MKLYNYYLTESIHLEPSSLVVPIILYRRILGEGSTYTETEEERKGALWCMGWIGEHFSGSACTEITGVQVPYLPQHLHDYTYLIYVKPFLDYL